MGEIKVGEYVRSKRGIDKVIEIKTVSVKMNGQHIYSYKLEKSRLWIEETQIENHSFNIIDLRKVGDLIEVQEHNGKHKWIMLIREEDIEETERYIEDDLLEVISILTKDQFDREKYIVGG